MKLKFFPVINGSQVTQYYVYTTGNLDMISPFETENSYLTKICVACVAPSGFITFVNS